MIYNMQSFHSQGTGKAHFYLSTKFHSEKEKNKQNKQKIKKKEKKLESVQIKPFPPIRS